MTAVKTEPILRVRGLGAGYGLISVLTDVSLDIGPGEIVGLAGLNGAGKTTALRALSGVIPRSASVAMFDGRPLPPRAHVVARCGLAHVPEGRRLFGHLTVVENLRFGAVAGGRSESAARLRLVLDAFPRLVELLPRHAGHLSGGEQQMLAIARGLMADPRLLMVDELSLGLSPKAGADISRALVGFARRDGLALLLVDQNVTLLRTTCDRLYLLRDGSTCALAANLDVEEVNAALF